MPSDSRTAVYSFVLSLRTRGLPGDRESSHLRLMDLSGTPNQGLYADGEDSKSIKEKGMKDGYPEIL